MCNHITHAIRLKPGEDLKQSLRTFVYEKNIQAGWMITCVGSLTEYHIRFANQQQASNDKGFFEILSVSGTVSVNGSHLHICIADATGKTIGVIYQRAALYIPQQKLLLGKVKS